MEENKDAQKSKRPASLRKRSSGFFRRSGRNSLSGDRGLDSRSGPTSPTLDFLPSVDTTLSQDKSLSRFFTKSKPAVIAENPNEPVKNAATPAQPSNASLYSRSATMLSRRSNDTGVTSDYQYQSTILTLQTKIMTESQEREAIQSKYAALVKIHEAQRSELSTYKLGKTPTSPVAPPANASAAPAVAAPAVASAPPAAATVAPVQPTLTSNADSALYERLGDVLTQLHDWVFSHFNDSKIGKLSPEDKSIIERVTSSGVSINDVPRAAILQALATSSFLNVFHDPFFPGLPAKFDSLKTSRELLKSSTSPVVFTQWRASTVSALIASNDATIKQGAEDLARRVVSSTDAVMARLASSKDAAARQQKLKIIVDAAIELARQLKAENADFDFHLPIGSAKKSITFDESLMDDVTAGQTPAAVKAIQIILSPVVYRLAGDGVKTVTLKSRVVCKA